MTYIFELIIPFQVISNLFQYVENVLICLKYDFMHIFMHHLSLYFETTAQIAEVEYGGKYGYMRANTDI
jgi:hypothetical protein